MHKLYVCVAIAVLCPFLVPRAATGCKCLYETPAAAFNRSKAVFIGKVLGGTETLSPGGENGKQPVEAGDLRFEVEESFKGIVGAKITIKVASLRGTDCGPYGLRRGERYIVYAYGREEDPDTLYSGVCTRTALVESRSSKEDLDFLRNHPPGKQQLLVIGAGVVGCSILLLRRRARAG